MKPPDNQDPQPFRTSRTICTRGRAVLLTITTLVVLVYLASSNLQRSPTPNNAATSTAVDLPLPHHYLGAQATLTPYTTLSPCEDPTPPIYDILANDTILFIHIQKTGGSDFLRHLVTVQRNDKYLCKLPEFLLYSIENKYHLPKGKQRIHCPKNMSDANSTQWLLSEKTLGWRCGVHPTLSEYKKCEESLDTGNGSKYSQYRHVTILRHPVLRYLSEFEHVVRGARWPARKKCGGKRASNEDMPACYPGFYEGMPWSNVSLADFISCKSNWASNRQVTWLANLESAGCFNSKFPNRDEILLATAKCNLEKFAFFGLTEYQEETSFLFEKVFNVTFSSPPKQYNITWLHTAPMLRQLWRQSALYDKIAAVNHLDMQLYEHALKMFARRAKVFGLTIDFQKVDKSVRSIRNFNINMTAKKFSKGKFDIPAVLST